MKKYLLLSGLLAMVIVVSAGSFSHSPPEKATVVSVVDYITPDFSTASLGAAIVFNQDAEINHFYFVLVDTGYNDPYLERSERWRRNRNLTLTGIFYDQDRVSPHMPIHNKRC